MILAIDCGNSRVKWGLCGRPVDAAASPIDWVAQGAVAIEQLAQLPVAWAFQEDPEAVVIANVAGQAVANELAQGLKKFRAAPRWIASSAAQCGVINTYADPARLGADRWAALIAARALHPRDCLVVMAGTATTIDVLSGNGEFRGGLILPGERLMKQALAERTAGLPLARGVVTDTPRDTGDAIETGCFFAQLGAIERMFARLSADGICLLSGGAAGRMAEHLNIPVRVVDNLVLEGLVRIATG
ncbi:MAG: hypothetical protein A3H35_17040 [Betaproteobacteria bacterium RIFCSPLOWO2_02_FULL_62_17]|nr:MAG: hypothetical protein A3H35_17040 [Betaproteobacteria bacterium RIFCSPLOWO2_02_FULL_62_17]